MCSAVEIDGRCQSRKFSWHPRGAKQVGERHASGRVSRTGYPSLEIRRSVGCQKTTQRRSAESTTVFAQEPLKVFLRSGPRSRHGNAEVGATIRAHARDRHEHLFSLSPRAESVQVQHAHWHPHKARKKEILERLKPGCGFTAVAQPSDDRRSPDCGSRQKCWYCTRLFSRSVSDCISDQN